MRLGAERELGFSLEEAGDPARLRERWQELADGLEVHASAEEVVFYPHLLREVDDPDVDTVGDTRHAVHDHNDIRDAVRAVDTHEQGSDAWWEALRAAREVTADHLGEEERDMLPPFRESVPAERRGELGMQWLEFHEEHERAKGLSGADKDPDAYVAEHS